MSTAQKPIKLENLQLAVTPEAWRKQICSCTTCDSATCFAIRYHGQLGCRCLKCDHSKTCIFYQNLKANLQIDSKQPMILSELAEKVKQSEEIKQKTDIKKESDIVTCTKHTSKCKVCKCRQHDIKTDSPITPTTQNKLNINEYLLSDTPEATVKVKDTSKCKNCKCIQTLQDRKNLEKQVYSAFSSERNAPLELASDFTVEDKYSKCKTCRGPKEKPEESSKNDSTTQMVEGKPPEQNKVYLINDFSEPVIKVKDTNKCKICKCAEKISKNNVTTENIVTDKSSEPNKINLLNDFSEPVVKVKDTSKCKSCKCPSADNSTVIIPKTTPVVVEATKVNYTDICEICESTNANATKYMKEEKTNLIKECKCKPFLACVNKTSLPNAINETGQARNVLETKKCKKCFSKQNKDRLPSGVLADEANVQKKCTHSKSCTNKTGEEKPVKGYTGCQVCKCKSIYACLYNAKESWITPDVSSHHKRCKKCTAKPSKECCKIKSVSKEPVNILDSVDRCHKTHKAKDLRHCLRCPSNLCVTKICNTAEKHDTDTVTPTKDAEKSIIESEPRTNILERVRKFLAEKLIGHSCSRPDISTTVSERCVKEQKVCDGNATTTNASNVTIATEPSIINIVKKYIADKLTAKTTSDTQDVTKTKSQSGTENAGFVNRIVITTTTGKKLDNSKSNQGNNAENVGNEVVYEFVRNKNIKKCKCQNMCVQHTDTKNRKEDTSAKLSAQVMNVPYKEYQHTVKRNETHKDNNYDIFERIKDIYNSCTCKICECIANVAPVVNSEVCKCKPCECDKCRAYKKGQPSLNKHLNPCSCKPCECIACKMMGINTQTDFIVAPVGEGSQRAFCQCSPCGCFECGHSYTHTSRGPVTHEMATGVNRHLNCNCETCSNELCEQEGADTCNCDRHSKVMRKPVQRDTNDYDLHHCTVERTNKKRRHKNNNTIAMFATVPNSLNINGFKNLNHNSHTGKDLDLNHNSYTGKDLATNVIKIPQDFTSPQIPKKHFKPCNCRPCGCLKCIKHYFEGHDPTVCCGNRLCEICECINKNTSKSRNKPHLLESTDICKCKPCGCFDCRKCNIRCKSTENYDSCHANQPKKDADESESNLTTKNNSYYLSLINASDSERYLDRFLTEKENQNKSSGKIYPDQKKDLENLQLFCAVTPKMKSLNCINRIQDYRQDEVYKNHDHTSCTHNTYNENKIFDEVAMTDESSDVSTSDLANANESSTSPKKHVPSKSQESSCNSSGHDYSDYLIRFPRSAVETCINDVMNLNMHKKIDVVNYLKSSLKKCESSSVSENERSYNRISFKGRQSFENAGIFKNSTHTYKRSNSEITSEHTASKSSKSRKCSCECADCGCSGSCLNEDKILKNEKIQAGLTFLEREEYLWDSNYITSKSSMPSKMIDKSWNTQDSDITSKDKFILKKSNVTFSDNDNDNHKETLFGFPKYGNVINNPVITTVPDTYINYNSVQKTLQNAKAFSHELLNILSKYEKANKEFNSVTKTFESLHSSIFSNSVIKSKIIEETGNVNKDGSTNNSPRELGKKVVNPEKKTEYARTGYKLIVPFVEMSTGPDYEESELSAPQDELSTEYHRKEFRNEIIEPEERRGFKNDKTKSVLTTNLLDEQGSKNLITKSIVTEPHSEMNSGLDYDQAEPVLATETKSGISRIESVLIEPHVEINTYTDDNYSRSASKKLIEIISQAGCEVPDKPIIERISIKSSLLINDFPKLDKAVVESVNNEIDNKKLSTGFEAIPENPDLKKGEDSNNKNDEKNSRLDLKALKNKYQMYSQLIEHGILKCQRTVWNRSSISTSIALTESQITLSRLNIGIITQEDTSKRNNLNTVFINSEETVSDMPYFKIENKLAEKEKLTQSKGKRYFRPQSCKISVSKGHYNITEFDNGASTSQDDYVKADLRPRFESMPTMASAGASGMKSFIAPEIASIFTTESICSAKKISFQTVRKVSDHTVIVKWKVPSDINDVVGYEVLIDGRPAQNILNPHRNMAVVTCLPHNDKVVLTVKTITSKTSACGQYPSTSIVYRPHIK